MLKVSQIALIATLAIGLAAIVAPTAASAAATNCTFSCQPPPGGGDTPPPPDIPDNNEPGDEGTPDDGDEPGDGPGDEGGPDDGDEPGDGGDPGEGGDPGNGPDGIPDSGDEDVKLVVALDCAIKDEQAVTTDLWLVNVGTADLEAGMKIRYNIPATGDQGAFYLPKTIEAGGEGRLADFISEIPVGEDCRVEIIA